MESQLMLMRQRIAFLEEVAGRLPGGGSSAAVRGGTGSTTQSTGPGSGPGAQATASAGARGIQSLHSLSGPRSGMSELSGSSSSTTTTMSSTTSSLAEHRRLFSRRMVRQHKVSDKGKA